MAPEKFIVTEHNVPSQYIREYPDSVRDDQEAVLKLHVKQYTPREPPDPSLPSVSVLAAHGNGFPKEAYEPLWDDLVTLSRANGFEIHGIWMADMAHHGQSYVLNQDKISDGVSWLDHSRDLLHLTNHFRKDMKRPIIGMGHSMGGNQMVHLAFMHPRLLTGIVFLDPVLEEKRNNSDSVTGSSLAKMSTYRRDIWPSRREAAIALRRSRLYKGWEARAWDAFVEYGLRDLPTAAYPEVPADSKATELPVTLTTPATMEVHTFMRANFEGMGPDGKPVINRKTHADVPVGTGVVHYPFYRPEPALAWNRLPAVRPPALFILAEHSFSIMTPGMGEMHKQAGIGIGGSGGVAEGRVKRVVLKGHGHEFPFTGPSLAAETCAPWIGEIAREWKRDEEEWVRTRRALPSKAHAAPSEEWKKFVGPPLVRNGASKKPESKM